MADAVLPDRKIRRTPATKRRPRFQAGDCAEEAPAARREGRHGAQHTRPAIAIRPAWARHVRMAAPPAGQSTGGSRPDTRTPGRSLSQTIARASLGACRGRCLPRQSAASKKFSFSVSGTPGAATKLHGMRSRPNARPVRQGQPCPAAPTTPARKENTMKQHAMIAAALGSLLALGAVSTPAQAADPAAGKEKCYGVAKAGQNDCASPGSAHAAPASPRSTRTRCRGSSSRPAPARRWAACCSSLPSKPRTG